MVTNITGSGTFGSVYECHDLSYNNTHPMYKCAIKIVRSVKRYLDAAYIEADIICRLNQYDNNNMYTSQCVKLYNIIEFNHSDNKRYVGLVFELLGQSLYSFLKHNNYLSYKPQHVKLFAYQLIKAIQYCHNNKLVHTDLKLENLLFCDSLYTEQSHWLYNNQISRIPVNTELRLIDFGGSIFIDNNNHTQNTLIQTRQYRAPEVILNLNWTDIVDIWSIGCILCECVTGSLLFQTHNDNEHIELIQRICQQPIPSYMIAQAISNYQKHINNEYIDTNTLLKQWEYSRSILHINHNNINLQHYDNNNNNTITQQTSRSPSITDINNIFDITTGLSKWPNNQVDSQQSIYHVNQQKTLYEQFYNYDILFYDLITKMLQTDPNKRITAQQALQHTYFDDIRQDMYILEQKLLNERNIIQPYLTGLNERIEQLYYQHKKHEYNKKHNNIDKQQQLQQRQKSSSHSHHRPLYDIRDIRQMRPLHTYRADTKYYQQYDVRDVRFINTNTKNNNGSSTNKATYSTYKNRHNNKRSQSPRHTMSTYKYARSDVRNTPHR